MGDPTDVQLEDRVAALSARIDDALARVRAWIPRGPRPDPRPDPSGGADALLEQLELRLSEAEANVALQVQRCAVLEDRIVELEAALVGAREARARAEAVAEDAQREANAALDQLEVARAERSGPVELEVGVAFQEKLLEVERLARERDALRSTNTEWRSKAQAYRRERDEATLALSRTTSELEELRERDASSRRKLAELERRLAEQSRELESAKRRAEHMRQHLRSNPSEPRK